MPTARSLTLTLATEARHVWAFEQQGDFRLERKPPEPSSDGGEEFGGQPIHSLGRKELKSYSHLHFAKGEVLGQQQRQSVRAAGVPSWGQAALIQRSVDLSTHRTPRH